MQTSKLIQRLAKTFLAGVMTLGSACHAQSAREARTPLNPSQWEKALEEGDLVFIRSRTENAALIAALSNVDTTDEGKPGEEGFEQADRIFTHCGIVFRNAGKWMIYEGAGRGRVLQLADWRIAESKAQGNGGRSIEKPQHNVYVRRWRDRQELSGKLRQILACAKRMHEKDYDFGFSWTNDYTYCSELVWKAYAEGGLHFGKLPKMSGYVDHVSKKVAKKIKEKLQSKSRTHRGGRGYDPQEAAVSPEDIFESAKLIPVTGLSR